MDEKLLDEIRRQEQAFVEDNEMSEEDVSGLTGEEEKEPLPAQEEIVSESDIPAETQDGSETDSGETKQTTLFGGDY